MRTLAFATFFVWRLRTGACGVGACGFWRYRMPPTKLQINPCWLRTLNRHETSPKQVSLLSAQPDYFRVFPFRTRFWSEYIKAKLIVSQLYSYLQRRSKSWEFTGAQTFWTKGEYILFMTGLSSEQGQIARRDYWWSCWKGQKRNTSDSIFLILYSEK